MSAGAWMVWARAQMSVKASDRALLGELALLADEAGLCSASISYLADVTGMHRATVFRSLERLEGAGLVRREAQFGEDRGRRESLFQLGEHVVPVAVEEPSTGCGCRARLEALSGVEDSSSDKLRGVLDACVQSNWCECADGALSELLVRQGNRQFASTARRRVRLSSEERMSDTVSVAWQICREKSEVLLNARSAWGLLTDMVRKACVELDVRPQAQDEQVWSPEILSEVAGGQVLKLGDVDKPKHVDLMGVLPVVRKVEEELVSAGFSRSLVRAVNRRVLDIALNTRKSREHTVAAQDEVLSMLIPTAQARRYWMTLLIGSRRSGRNLLVSTPEERRVVIDQIRQSWDTKQSA